MIKAYQALQKKNLLLVHAAKMNT